MDLQAAFLMQAQACTTLGSPFMGQLMRLLAGHLLHDTALANLFGRWDGDPGPSGASFRFAWLEGSMPWF